MRFNKINPEIEIFKYKKEINKKFYKKRKMF